MQDQNHVLTVHCQFTELEYILSAQLIFFVAFKNSGIHLVQLGLVVVARLLILLPDFLFHKKIDISISECHIYFFVSVSHRWHHVNIFVRQKTTYFSNNEASTEAYFIYLFFIFQCPLWGVIWRGGNLCHTMTVCLFTFGGTMIEQVRVCFYVSLQKHKNKFVSTTFHMVKTNELILIGLQICQKLCLVTLNLVVQADNNVRELARKHQNKTSCRPKTMTSPLLVSPSSHKGILSIPEQILKEFPEVFSEIECPPGEYMINTNPNVPSVIHSLQRIPVFLRDEFKVKLDFLMKQAIILVIIKPTSYVNSFLCLKGKWINQIMSWTTKPFFGTPTYICTCIYT